MNVKTVLCNTIPMVKMSIKYWQLYQEIQTFLKKLTKTDISHKNTLTFTAEDQLSWLDCTGH